ncbi:hypothetical protein [Paenibacillus agaridevorans]|uniref:hypothetical protein n=1 Tax=Paenibacillus agaridevorans TaxID=171404 RepID=UPI001BE41C3E|nr:hypothetical protein [Paenibacillus agaridevorans]
MAVWKRVVGLTLLLTFLAFPASAFASNYSSSYDNNGSKGFFSSLLSVFGGSSGSGSSDSGSYGGGDKYEKSKASDKKNSSGFWDWWDDDWWDDDWWDDFCWWEDNKDDSKKIWEKYYCY